MNLDNIEIENIPLKDDYIKTIIMRYFSYRDWDSLIKFVQYWGISFKIIYRMNPYRPSPVPLRYCNGQPIIDRILILSIRDDPYYQKPSITHRNIRKHIKSIITAQNGRD